MSDPTPGPWVWHTSNSWKRLKRDDRDILQSVMEPYVCSDGHPDCIISEGDMRLIASAPDMLDFLLDLEDHLKRGSPADEGSFLREKLKDVVAKATGE